MWTARKLTIWSNQRSHGGEIYMVNLHQPQEPAYVGSYAATLKPGYYEQGWRLFRASHGRDHIKDIQAQLDNKEAQCARTS